nr:Arf1f [Gefionella okellyi]
MGNSVCYPLRPAKDVKVMIFGLDASGRTTYLYWLKLGEIITTIPTIGFNVESIQAGRLNITMWDCGGGDRLRPLWKHYFPAPFILWCIDRSDPQRLDESWEFFESLCWAEVEKNREMGICVAVTKWNKDCDEPLHLSHVQDKFSKLDTLPNPWFLTAVDCLTNYNVNEPLDWMNWVAFGQRGKFTATDHRCFPLIWSYEAHSRCPEPVKRVTMTLLLICGRTRDGSLRYPRAKLAWLPIELVLEIVRMVGQENLQLKHMRGPPAGLTAKRKVNAKYAVL